MNQFAVCSLQFPERRRALLETGNWKLTTDSGFTLIEVIVALVVLGFVLAGLGQATRFGMSAWTLETKLADNAAGLERMDRVLRRLIEQASPPAGADEKPLAGEEHRLVFMTLMPDQPQTEPVRHAQVAVGVDDHHQLVLRWRPHANAVPLLPLAPMQEIVLAEGIERIDLAYRQQGADGGKWQKKWAESNLPAMVQIHFVLANGRHRWPDMAVPTMLDSNGSF